MEKTIAVPVLWRDIAVVALLALLLHIMTWCCWLGLENRWERISALQQQNATSSPAARGQSQIAVRDTELSGARTLASSARTGFH